MRKSSALFLALTFALSVAGAGTGAQAAPILGSNVDSAIFSANIGSSSGWSYQGQSIAAFNTGGTASLISRSSSYANSFGYSRSDHTGITQTFGASAPAGSTALITGYSPEYLLYFRADGSDFLFFSDDNTQYSDGHDTGGFPGASQGGIDIFFNSALSTWAFFFDDAGGGISPFGDDDDYDDMVVTFQTAAANVPEPASAGLIGLGLLATAWMRRRKPATRI
jgi:hypothetical protein